VTVALFIAGLIVAAFGVPGVSDRVLTASRWARSLPERVSIDVKRPTMWTAGEIAVEIRPSPAALRRADMRGPYAYGEHTPGNQSSSALWASVKAARAAAHEAGVTPARPYRGGNVGPGEGRRD